MYKNKQSHKNHENEYWHEHHREQKGGNEESKKSEHSDRKKDYIGWIALVLVFVFKFFPWNILISIVLAVFALINKDHNKSLAMVSLIFALAFLFIFSYLFFIM